jgi:hypothetical protein
MFGELQKSISWSERDEPNGYRLAFPARWMSGRPALAVSQPLDSANAMSRSVVVHKFSWCLSDGLVPSRHVRLSSTGGDLRAG